MNQNESKFIGRGIITPVICAVILGVIAGAVMLTVDFPFTQKTVHLADYQYEEIKNPSEFKAPGEKIRVQDVASCIDGNTLIGDISLGNSTYPLVFKGDEVNAMGKFNIKNNIFPGEAGVCVAEIYKNNANMLKLLSSGDTVSLNTFYSSYEYEVIETSTADNYSELKRFGEGQGNALVLYTDNSVGPGISDEYFVCVCKMTSGNVIVG